MIERVRARIRLRWSFEDRRYPVVFFVKELDCFGKVKTNTMQVFYYGPVFNNQPADRDYFCVTRIGHGCFIVFWGLGRQSLVQMSGNIPISIIPLDLRSCGIQHCKWCRMVIRQRRTEMISTKRIMAKSTIKWEYKKSLNAKPKLKLFLLHQTGEAQLRIVIA